MTGRDREFLMWVAGFLEGEGSFTLNDGSPRITAVQVDREVLVPFMRFGGTIQRAKRSAPRHDLFQWNLFGRDAEGLMLMLYPLMSRRRQDRIRCVLEGPVSWANRPDKSHKALRAEAAAA